MGFRDIEVEGDALGIIKQLKILEDDYFPIGTIIEETRNKAGLLNSCYFNHLGKNGNVVAHGLAKYGIGATDYTLFDFFFQHCGKGGESVDRSYINGLSAAVFTEIDDEFDRLVIREGAKALGKNRGLVDKKIVALAVESYETENLLGIDPFDCDGGSLSALEKILEKALKKGRSFLHGFFLYVVFWVHQETTWECNQSDACEGFRRSLMQSEDTRAMARHCTVGIEPRISAERLILLDTQSVFSHSVLSEIMRPDGSSTVSVLSGESLSAELTHEIINIQVTELQSFCFRY
ncbi:hypothetical protein CRYUN_Cryun24cG0071900 [Craigia yunnanensis]